MRLLWDDRDFAVDAGILGEPLLRLGLHPGHRVAVATPNGPAHLLLHAAAARHGWTVVPIDPADPGWSVPAAACDAIVAPAGSPLLAGSGRPAVAWGPDGSVGVRPGPLRPPPPGPAPAFAVRTSGTAGAPRAVAIDPSMLEAHAAAANARIGDGPASTWLAVLPLHRIGAIAMADRVRRNGGTLVLEPRFDAPRAAARLQAGGVTHLSLVPAMLRRLLDAWGDGAPPAGLRCLLLGGDRAPEALVRPALERGWPVWCTYGMTESCSQAATATPQERLDRPETSGRPLRGVRVDIDGGETGEIMLSGPTVAGGGPLRTGDLGRFDGGFLTVAGRRDDRITTGGVKVDPGPVEEALVAHPAVAEACVVGLSDAEWGERVAAAVVLRPGHALPDLPNLRAWCKGRLAPPAVPREVRAVEALPRTESGKMRRAAVRALLQGRTPT